jgi:hypothetical protein
LYTVYQINVSIRSGTDCGRKYLILFKAKNMSVRHALKDTAWRLSDRNLLLSRQRATINGMSFGM